MKRTRVLLETNTSYQTALPGARVHSWCSLEEHFHTEIPCACDASEKVHAAARGDSRQINYSSGQVQ